MGFDLLSGVPPADLPLALVSFNVGVVLGQLAFVILVLSLARTLQKLRVTWPQPAQVLPAYLVGSFGAFWLVQRLAVL